MRCVICGSMATQRHHCFANTKMNRRNYDWLIDEEFNIEPVCADCHSSHAKIPPCLIWNEEKFRDEALKHNYSLLAGSKVFQFKERMRLMYESNGDM